MQLPEVSRTIVLSAALPLAKLHNVLQSVMGWRNSLKHMFVTKEGIPIAKTNSKEDIPCLSGSKIRLAYVLTKSGDEMYYQYGPWVHRLVVETIGAPRRNIPSIRVVAGVGACPPDDNTPATYSSSLALMANQLPFSIDDINMKLMSGQTFYMRLPKSATKQEEEQVCLRAMRTPVNIPRTPTSSSTAPASLQRSYSDLVWSPDPSLLSSIEPRAHSAPGSTHFPHGYLRDNPKQSIIGHAPHLGPSIPMNQGPISTYSPHHFPQQSKKEPSRPWAYDFLQLYRSSGAWPQQFHESPTLHNLSLSALPPPSASSSSPSSCLTSPPLSMSRFPSYGHQQQHQQPQQQSPFSPNHHFPEREPTYTGHDPYATQLPASHHYHQKHLSSSVNSQPAISRPIFSTSSAERAGSFHSDQASSKMTHSPEEALCTHTAQSRSATSGAPVNASAFLPPLSSTTFPCSFPLSLQSFVSPQPSSSSATSLPPFYSLNSGTDPGGEGRQERGERGELYHLPCDYFVDRNM